MSYATAVRLCVALAVLGASACRQPASEVEALHARVAAVRAGHDTVLNALGNTRVGLKQLSAEALDGRAQELLSTADDACIKADARLGKLVASPPPVAPILADELQEAKKRVEDHVRAAADAVAACEKATQAANTHIMERENQLKEERTNARNETEAAETPPTEGFVPDK